MTPHPYAPFLAEIHRPGQYLGGEYGIPRSIGKADLRMVFAFPDSYEIGMSHIGLSVLYEIANGIPGVACERVFMPWFDLERHLRAERVPLVSLETATPIHAFDVVGFSLQYELNYTNLLAMLELGGIPLRAPDRGEGAPLVLAGGPLAMHAEPIAPFIDLFLVGDGEEALPELLGDLARCRAEKLDRGATIDRLARHPAVFAPNRLERRTDPLSSRQVVSAASPKAARRAVVPRLGDHPPGFGPVPAVQAVFDRYSIEVARGCSAGCRFCQAGFLYRPVRERTAEEIGAAAERAVCGLGFDSLSLAALSTADHSLLEPLIRDLGERYTRQKVSLAVPSLRAYGVPDRVVEVLGRLRATGVTLAPEAGSQRMRDRINKNITEADLEAGVCRFFQQGFTKIKLYFMIGLPDETDEEIREIVRLAERIRDLGRRRLGGRTPGVTVSVSTFVPKPFTPFEREPMIDLDEIRRRQEILRGLGRETRIPVRLHDPRLSLLEALLCRGDVSLAPVLERAVALGARFDGWEEHFDASAWTEALGGVDVGRQLAAIPDDARLPWDHIDGIVDPAFLRDERDRSRNGRLTEPCGRFETRGGEARFVCHGCGLSCDPDDLPLRPPPPEQEAPLPSPRAVRPRPRAVPAEASRPPERVRLFLAKWGRQAFVGHLDTMGQLMRIVRRAGLDLAYTQGFHPKPKMESAPPLPLGVSGLREPLEIHLLAPPPDTELLSRLNGAAPDEIRFVACERIPPRTRSLSRMIEAAEYLAFVQPSPEEVRPEIERVLASPSLEVERRHKAPGTRFDIRPFVVGAALSDGPWPDLPFEPPAGRTALTFTLALSPSGSVRASEFLEAALGARARDAAVVRAKFIFSSPFPA